MEMMNATVKLSADKAECWVPTQNLEASLAALSEASGIPLAKCEVHRHDLGGGFGRRGGTQDYVHQAVAIAKRIPRHAGQADLEPRGRSGARLLPPDLDMQDVGRPRRRRANLVGLHVRSSGPVDQRLAQSGRHRRRQGPRASSRAGTDEPGDAQLGYTVPNLLIEYVMRNTHVPVGPWRGVNTNQNGLYMECFIEECARAAGKDSLEFRRALMKQPPQAPRGAQRRGREGRLGQAIARGRASRHRAVHGLWQLFGGDGRSLGRRARAS